MVCRVSDVYILAVNELGTTAILRSGPRGPSTQPQFGGVNGNSDDALFLEVARVWNITAECGAHEAAADFCGRGSCL